MSRAKKTLQEQFNLINNGEGRKDLFLREAKMVFPQYVPNNTTYDNAVTVLKQKGVISEGRTFLGTSTSNPFTNFNEFLDNQLDEGRGRPKGKGKKNDYKGYDPSDLKNADNVMFDQLINGIAFELKQKPEMSIEEARDKAMKNLSKNQLHYMENAAFGIEGVGYKTMEGTTEVKGKHKGSGYGDLKLNENTMKNEISRLLKEHIGGVASIGSIGNPFADRPVEDYEAKFEAFAKNNSLLALHEEEVEEADEVTQEEVEATEEAVEENTRMDMKEIEKMVETVGNIAKYEAQLEVYQTAITQRNEALSLATESSVAEFISDTKVKELQNEVKVLEKYCSDITAEINNLKQ